MSMQSTVPPRCELCQKSFTSEPVYYDASIPTHGGQWGYVCDECFKSHGCSLGMGKGQKFSTKTGKKVEG